MSLCIWAHYSLQNAHPSPTTTPFTISYATLEVQHVFDLVPSILLGPQKLVQVRQCSFAFPSCVLYSGLTI